MEFEVYAEIIAAASSLSARGRLLAYQTLPEVEAGGPLSDWEQQMFEVMTDASLAPCHGSMSGSRARMWATYSRPTTPDGSRPPTSRTGPAI